MLIKNPKLVRVLLMIAALCCVSFSATLRAETNPNPTINLVFVDVSADNFADGKKLMEQLRRTESLTDRHCWACEKEERYGLWFLYMFHLPAGITPELALAAAEGSRVSMREIRKGLRQFKDPEDGQTVDGLIVYQHSLTEINAYAISPVEGVLPFHERISITAPLGLRELDQLIEKLSRKLLSVHEVGLK